MKLFTSPPSPFGRKARITAAMKGLLDAIEIVTADTNPPGNAALLEQNPLGKIPVLVLDDGTRLFDSRVICEYLDSAGAPGTPRLLPAAGPERWRTLTRAALADGITDAGVLIVYEKRFRPETHWNPGWVARQQSKVDAGLDMLEADPPEWAAHPDYSHVALACCLGHFDFRHDSRWRVTRPRLVSWLERFAAEVPSFAETMPHV
jgi:glutathione S-transferase